VVRVGFVYGAGPLVQAPLLEDWVRGRAGRRRGAGRGPHAHPGLAERVGSGDSAFDRRMVAIARLIRVKRPTPFLDELKPVAVEQEFPEPVRAAGPLMMADAGGRLVQHDETMRSQRHR